MAASAAFAQAPMPIEISYDAAGNRITRKVMMLNMSKGGSYGDSTYYLDRMNAIQMKVYPNPTTGKVFVEMFEAEEIGKSVVRVYDNQGKRMYENTNKGSFVEVDMSSFPSGYYIVDLWVKEEHTTWKIIKK